MYLEALLFQTTTTNKRQYTYSPTFARLVPGKNLRYAKLGLVGLIF